MKTLNIPTTKGREDVPAFFVDGVSALAITMTNFGIFEVTHVKLGFKIIGGFERFANAAVEMLSLHLAMHEAGIDFEAEQEEFKRQIKESSFKSAHISGLTLFEYLQVMRPVMGFSGEFPWEGEEESPHTKASQLIAKINEIKGVNQVKETTNV
jgi:hypothetical protein